MDSLLKDILMIDREIVGVTLCMKKEDYTVSDVSELKKKMSYCNMVKYATKGKAFKATLDHFFCGGSQRALGMRPLEDNVMTGEEYYSYKMYDSLQVAKSVQEEVTYLPTGTYGVIVAPLKAAVKPDIVIMIVNPYQAMRITQGYAYHMGIAKNIKFTGNQGICSECTAAPYINQDMNVSLLCANTRFSAQWQEYEMAIGLPFDMFEKLVFGVLKTLNASEPDKRKVKMMDLNDKYDIDISLKTSYYKSSKR